MALVHVQMPKGISYISMIEDYMAERFSLRKLPIKRYLTATQLKTILRNVRDIRAYLIKSTIVHGFEVPGTGQILIHPDTAFKALRSRKAILSKVKI